MGGMTTAERNGAHALFDDMLAQRIELRASSQGRLSVIPPVDMSDAVLAGWKNRVKEHEAELFSLVTGGSPDEDELAPEPITIVNATPHGSKKSPLPVPIDELIGDVNRATGGWPRRVDNALFVDDKQHGIGWFDKPAALFGYLQTISIGGVEWHSGVGMVKQAELFAELQRTARRYVSVETWPHEPLVDGHYYTCGTVKPGDGQTLQSLLDRFSPAEDIDRDLILAAFLTPGWGGPAGSRPCFVITSGDGRGAGKSTLAEMIGLVWDGVLSFSHNEDVNKIKTRLLSPEALPRRVALLDNLKSLNFSWGELEAMITAASIGGHRMYVGEACRPNTLTWFITLNGASLSTDMAQRSIVVKVRKPKRSATWAEETKQFIVDHRVTIIGDIIAALRAEPEPLDEFTRWATWERHVLQRLPRPAEAQKFIMKRQDAVDVEADEVAILDEFFADQLDRLHYDADNDQVFIPSRTVTQWYNWATNEQHKTVAVSRIIGQMVDEGRSKRLRRNTCRTWGRGFVWVGSTTDIEETVQIDVEERIRHQYGQARQDA